MTLLQGGELPDTHAIVTSGVGVDGCMLALASFHGGGGLWGYLVTPSWQRSWGYLTLNRTPDSNSYNSKRSDIVSGQAEKHSNVRS